MNERESEQGIQASRPAETDTRITSEEQLLGLPDRAGLLSTPVHEKPLSKIQSIGILLGSCLAGVALALSFVWLRPRNTTSVPPAAVTNFQCIETVYLGPLGGFFGLVVGVVFLLLKHVADKWEAEKGGERK